MSHPAEYWVKFLMSRREHTFTEIEGMCEMALLSGVKTEHMQYLRYRFEESAPVPFRGHDIRHRPSTTFLRQEGIYDAWHRGKPMRAAIDLLAESRVRALVETFILSPLKPEQAVAKIKKSTGHCLDVKTYELFRHYFWNPELLSGEEWGEYIARRRVAHQDWLRLARTSRGPKGVQLLLWKTGTGPIRHVDVGKMFAHMRNVAFMKVLEMEHEPAGKDHAAAFRNYVQSAKLAQEEVTASAAAMADVLDSFKAFKMATVDDEVLSLAELTDGSKGTVSLPGDVIGADDKIKMEDY